MTTLLCLTALLCISSISIPATAEDTRRQGTAADVPLPDREIDGFSVWLGSDGKLDRVVVLVEAFDPFNDFTARDSMRLVKPVADQLFASGIDVLVVDFPDSHPAPDVLAPQVARAVRSAAQACGAPVGVVGLSAGGLAARWALVTAEEKGDPLPVHTLLLVDCPNRGARLHPALQAMTMRYGEKKDRAALSCAAARVVMTAVPRDIKWKVLGLPGARRRVPVGWTLDDSAHREFFGRLARLNARRGYPQRCRVIAVAQGSRETGPPREELLHLWLPFGFDWNCRAEEPDRAPGSLLPRRIADRFRIRRPLGLAGSYFRNAPTFVATESALDAAPGERPPFDEWYSRAEGLPPIAHDQPDPEAAGFAFRALAALGR